MGEYSKNITTKKILELSHFGTVIEIFKSESNPTILGLKRPDVSIDSYSLNAMEEGIGGELNTIFCSTQLNYVNKTIQKPYASEYLEIPHENCSIEFLGALLLKGYVIQFQAKEKVAEKDVENIILELISQVQNNEIKLEGIVRASSSVIQDKLKWKKNLLRISARHIYNILRHLISDCNVNLIESKVADVIKSGEIIFKPKYFALGDLLVISVLPKLLFEQYGVKFYFDDECRYLLDKNPFYEFIFKKNPYYLGFKKTKHPFEIISTIKEQGITSFILNKNHINGCERLVDQFQLRGKSIPDVYYVPKKIKNFENTILIDLNWRSGKNACYYLDYSLVDEIVRKLKLKDSSLEVQYVCVSAQSIYEYVDMINSSKHFICLFSGGNVLSAAYSIPAFVVLPETISNEAAREFMFTNSPITYVRRGALPK